MDECNFYSIDRLIEFGMGVAAATQMVNSMNLGLEGMQVPGAGRPLKPVLQPVFYCAKNGKAEGPFSEAEMVRCISEKKVRGETYVWIPGMPEWQPAKNLPEMLRLAALVPPPIPEEGRS